MRITLKTIDSNIGNDVPLKDMLQRYRIENDLSKRMLSKILSVNEKTITSYLDGGDIKLSHAFRIMKLLKLSLDDLSQQYLKDAQDEEVACIERAQLASFLLDNFDLKSLKQEKVITSNNDYDLISNEICQFFDLDSIYDFSNPFSKSALFSQARFSSSEIRKKKMQDFWLKCAQASFEKINNPNEYDEGLLFDFLKRIKSYTKDVEYGFSKVVYVLFQLGVTVIVQPYMTQTKAYGVSMIVNGKPCVILTDLGKNYYKLWLTLLHELYHIISDYEYISRINYHVSGEDEQDLFVSESDADRFALYSFLPEKSIAIASKIIRMQYKVQELAKIADIHPAMVYGVYLESIENKNIKSKEFARYTGCGFILKSEVAIKNIIFDPVKQRGISIAAKKLKENLKIMTA